MNKIFCTFVFLGSFLTSSAFASFVSYETLENFHKSRIESIVSEYDLSRRAKITYSLLPKAKVKKQKSAIIKLPGLMLEAISLSSIKKEVGLVEIIDALKDYKRKVVILKSSKVTDQEIKVLQQALQDELFLPDTKSFVVKDWSVGQIWYNDLKSSFQNKVLSSPYTYLGLVVFLVISFLIFSLSSSVLNGFKHVGKSIYDSVEKSVAGSGGSDASMGASPVTPDALSEADKESSLGSEQDHSRLGQSDQAPDCHALLKLITKTVSLKPNELRIKMWEIFPAVEDQLSLYIAFETGLGSEEMESFSKLFESIFQIGSTENKSASKAGSGNIQTALWKFRIGLTHLVVKPVDEVREKSLGAFSENYRGQMNDIIDSSLEKHFKLVSYLFQEKVNKRIGKMNEFGEGFSDQILSYVTYSPEQKIPTELDIKNFNEHLKSHNYFLEESKDLSRQKDFALLSRLPDHILFSSDKFNAEMLKEMNANIPNFSWIDAENTKLHKKFILSLTPDEATHFMTRYSKIVEFKESIDARTSSRLQGLKMKSQNPDSVKAILGLRSKIGSCYKALGVQESHDVKVAA